MSQSTASETPRFPIGLTIASVIGIVILIGLGVWQVQRLHWKEALLAKVGPAHAPTGIDPGPAGWPGNIRDGRDTDRQCPVTGPARPLDNVRPGRQ